MSGLSVGRAVEAFMLLMGQDVPTKPTHLDEATWELRTDLIIEEFKEIDEAYEAGDLAAFLDGCVDLVYVVVGMAVAAGLPFDKAFDEVHRANMSKAAPCTNCSDRLGYVIDEGEWRACPDCNGTRRIVIKRDDGKILKPVGWQPPNIEKIIEEAAGVEGV